MATYHPDKVKWFVVRNKPHVWVLWSGPGTYAPIYSVAFGRFVWFAQKWGEFEERIAEEWIRVDNVPLASGILN